MKVLYMCAHAHACVPVHAYDRETEVFKGKTKRKKYFSMSRGLLVFYGESASARFAAIGSPLLHFLFLRPLRALMHEDNSFLEPCIEIRRYGYVLRFYGQSTSGRGMLLNTISRRPAITLQ